MNGLEQFKDMRSWMECEIPDSEEVKKEFDFIEQELEVLNQLNYLLDANTMFRALPYSVAKQMSAYLKSNEVVNKWLKGEQQ